MTVFGPIPFRVLLDGEAPGPSHGVNVDEDGNGLLRDGRLYQLVRQHHTVHERTLEITFLQPGAEAYVFTFGWPATATYPIDHRPAGDAAPAREHERLGASDRPAVRFHSSS